MPSYQVVTATQRSPDGAQFAPEVRAAWFRLVEQGWTDALRKVHGQETIYTFWDYFRNAYARDAGLRIDHFLLSKTLARKLQDAQVDREVRGWEKTSDHAPVWIELKD
jgi:exodeoxyribonuclease-3